MIAFYNRQAVYCIRAEPREVMRVIEDAGLGVYSNPNQELVVNVPSHEQEFTCKWAAVVKGAHTGPNQSDCRDFGGKVLSTNQIAGFGHKTIQDGAD